MRAVAALVLLIGCGGSEPVTPAATFTAIYDAIFPAETGAKCNFCHAMPASDISNGHLHMGVAGERDVAYAALVGQTSTSSRCFGRPLVLAGHPEQSLMYTKLTTAPLCGGRMPLGTSGLPDVQIEMVRSWIAAGAHDD